MELWFQPAFPLAKAHTLLADESVTILTDTIRTEGICIVPTLEALSFAVGILTCAEDWGMVPKKAAWTRNIFPLCAQWTHIDLHEAAPDWHLLYAQPLILASPQVLSATWLCSGSVLFQPCTGWCTRAVILSGKRILKMPQATELTAPPQLYAVTPNKWSGVFQLSLCHGDSPNWHLCTCR